MAQFFYLYGHCVLASLMVFVCGCLGILMINGMMKVLSWLIPSASDFDYLGFARGMFAYTVASTLVIYVMMLYTIACRYF